MEKEVIRKKITVYAVKGTLDLFCTIDCPLQPPPRGCYNNINMHFLLIEDIIHRLTRGELSVNVFDQCCFQNFRLVFED